MTERFKQGPLQYYRVDTKTLRPGDYISGERCDQTGWVFSFMGVIRSIYEWPDGTYIYFHDDTPLRISNKVQSTLEIFRHNKRGDHTDV